ARDQRPDLAVTQVPAGDDPFRGALDRVVIDGQVADRKELERAGLRRDRPGEVRAGIGAVAARTPGVVTLGEAVDLVPLPRDRDGADHPAALVVVPGAPLLAAG